MFKRIVSLLCGISYIIYCVVFLFNHLFDIGQPLDLDDVFIAMMCLGGYLSGANNE